MTLKTGIVLNSFNYRFWRCLELVFSKIYHFPLVAP